MAEEQLSSSEDMPKSLAKVAAALEQHIAAQTRMHEQSVELSRRHLELAEASNVAYRKSLELQETNAKRYENRLAEQKQQSKWALVILAVMAIGLVIVVLLTGHTQ